MFMMRLSSAPSPPGEHLRSECQLLMQAEPSTPFQLYQLMTKFCIYAEYFQPVRWRVVDALALSLHGSTDCCVACTVRDRAGLLTTT